MVKSFLPGDARRAGQILRGNFQLSWIFYIRTERDSATLWILGIHYRADFGKDFFDYHAFRAFKLFSGLINGKRNTGIKKSLFVPEKKRR